MCLAQGQNAVTLVRLEPAAPLSQVKHSTTSPLRSCKSTAPACKEVFYSLHGVYTIHPNFICLCMLSYFACVFINWLFFQNHFSKDSFRNTIIVSNSLDSDQERQNVGPDLGQNCLQRFSISTKDTGRQRVKSID